MNRYECSNACSGCIKLANDIIKYRNLNETVDQKIEEMENRIFHLVRALEKAKIAILNNPNSSDAAKELSIREIESFLRDK